MSTGKTTNTIINTITTAKKTWHTCNKKANDKLCYKAKKDKQLNITDGL